MIHLLGLLRRYSRRLFQAPNELLLILSFFVLIVIGTGLLLIPAATKSGQISFVDALFTATSATCVTGLIVVDTGSYFSFFGQAVILSLIQLGGLGMVTISSFFAILLGKKMPLKQRYIVRKTHDSLDPREFRHVVKRIVVFALSLEAIAASLLFLSWRHDFPLGEALWQATFHAVSAFCNAGFSLFHDSLLRFQSDWGVNLVFLTLIFLGGIGFLVIYDCEKKLFYGGKLSLHSKLVLYTSLVLIAMSVALFLGLEWNNALRDFSWSDRLLIALFQSVTPRTAGFNTIDYGSLTSSTLIVTLLLMFVGGSPGSTAGGIKTTTFAVFLFTGLNRFQGRVVTNVLKRTVPERIVNESISIVLISIAILILFNFGLQLTETGSIPHTQAPESFLQTNFEVVSAFGTVGLSTGVTSDLSEFGKLQIILLMFVGRLGPLSIAVAMARRYQKRVHYEYYKENVMVG